MVCELWGFWDIVMILWAFFLGAASPGPDFLITARNSLLISRTAGLWTGLGVSLGFILNIAYSIAFVTYLSPDHPAFLVLQYGGAAYLCYLGVRSLMTKGGSLTANKPGEKVAHVSSGKMLWESFLIHALNPNAALLVVSLYLLATKKGMPFSVQLALGGGMFIISLIWFSIVALLLSAPAIQKKLAPYQVWIDRVAGVFFILLAILLVKSDCF